MRILYILNLNLRKLSAQALAKLMNCDFAKTHLVAIYVDGIIVARYPRIHRYALKRRTRG